MTMQPTDDEKHLETLKLLAEVLQYLRRLSPVPMTTQLCLKIQRHIDAPAARLVELSLGVRRGAAYAPNGAQLLDASLYGDQLTIRSQSFPDGLTMQLGMLEAGSFDGEGVTIIMADGKRQRQLDFQEFAALAPATAPAPATTTKDTTHNNNDDGIFYE